jgi:hypothetical protein
LRRRSQWWPAEVEPLAAKHQEEQPGIALRERDVAVTDGRQSRFGRFTKLYLTDKSRKFHSFTFRSRQTKTERRMSKT